MVHGTLGEGVFICFARQAVERVEGFWEGE